MEFYCGFKHIGKQENLKEGGEQWKPYPDLVLINVSVWAHGFSQAQTCGFSSDHDLCLCSTMVGVRRESAEAEFRLHTS